MMKKVLALVMVLSMVGFASAALQIEAAGGKAVVVGQLDKDVYLILSAGDGASLSGFGLGKDAPLASIGEMQGTAAISRPLAPRFRLVLKDKLGSWLPSRERPTRMANCWPPIWP